MNKISLADAIKDKIKPMVGVVSIGASGDKDITATVYGEVNTLTNKVDIHMGLRINALPSTRPSDDFSIFSTKAIAAAFGAKNLTIPSALKTRVTPQYYDTYTNYTQYSGYAGLLMCMIGTDYCAFTRLYKRDSLTTTGAWPCSSGVYSVGNVFSVDLYDVTLIY